MKKSSLLSICNWDSDKKWSFVRRYNREHEFEFAANELGFLHVEASLVVNMKEKLSSICVYLLDSYDYGRFAREMRSHEYFYCKDYMMACLFEDCQRLKNGLKSLDGSKGRVIVYGTGD